ncbi:MAG: hypothetical protein ACE5HL_01180 [Terriglobia bacterium]
MGFFNLFRRIRRPFWFICYNCLNRNGNNTLEAIFYYQGPPEVVSGRPSVRCPRCQDLNTRSFQFLKDEGEEAALVGLERIVKSNPPERFPVKPAARVLSDRVGKNSSTVSFRGADSKEESPNSSIA